MTLSAFAIVAPLLGTAILIVLAIAMSNRDVAKFQAAQRSSSTEAAIAKSDLLREAFSERFVKTTSALSDVSDDDLVLAAIVRTEFKRDNASGSRSAQLLRDVEGTSVSSKA